MKLSKHIQPLPNFRKASAATYVAGFALSVVLTLASFALVWAYRAAEEVVFSRGVLIGLLAVAAIMQILVQVLFFLHVSTERRVRINLYAGAFTVFVVLCLVIGSIWIMQNLDYNMMPRDITEMVEHDESLSQ
ncbi:cytochrome o ubiquinol oxidase subunit IV [Candidatus Saccharibacteria bacterium]|nr:MAG: cytochrome o ubiquinol oxidase subunit IV [Candidatus Saccharibacteria bacterium]